MGQLPTSKSYYYCIELLLYNVIADTANDLYSTAVIATLVITSKAAPTHLTEEHPRFSLNIPLWVNRP